MGQCIYVKGRDIKSGVEVREFRSEVWMDPFFAGRLLARDHFANSTLGLWLYESDLWDKVKLRKRLLALVEHVCAPGFLPEYKGPVDRSELTQRATRKRKATRPRRGSR